MALHVGVGNGHADNGNNELANSHAKSTDEEERTATIAFNAIQARQRHEDVHDTRSYADEECILDPSILEELGAVVENEIDYENQSWSYPGRS